MPHRPGHTLDSISRQVAPRYSVEGNMGPFGIGPQGGGMGGGQGNWLADALSWQVPGSQNLPRYPGRNIPGIGGYLDAAMGMFAPGVETQRMAEQGAGPWSLAGMMALDAPVVGPLMGGAFRGARGAFRGLSNLPQGAGNLLPWNKFRGVPSAGVQSSMQPPYSTPNLSMMGPYLERGRPTVMTRDAAGNIMPFYQSRGQAGNIPYDTAVSRLTGQGVDPTMASQIAGDISGRGQWVPSRGFTTGSGGQMPGLPKRILSSKSNAALSPYGALNAAQTVADQGLGPSMFRGNEWQQYENIRNALSGLDDPAVEFMGRYGNDPNLARMGAQITGDLGPQTAEGGFRSFPWTQGIGGPRTTVPPDMTGITNRMLGIGPTTATPQPKGSLTSLGTAIPAAAAIGGVAAKMPTQDEREGRAQYLAGQNRGRGGL